MRPASPEVTIVKHAIALSIVALACLVPAAALAAETPAGAAAGASEVLAADARRTTASGSTFTAPAAGPWRPAAMPCS